MGLIATSCGGASELGQDVEMCPGNIFDGPRPCDDGSILTLALAGLLILVVVGVFRFVFRVFAGPVALTIIPVFFLYAIRNEMEPSGTNPLWLILIVSFLFLSGTGAFGFMVTIVGLVKERKQAKIARQAYYDRGLEVLRQFVEREGHGRVPIGNVEPVGPEFESGDEYGLFVWCSRRIEERERGKLTEDEVAELEALGFDWTPKETKFRLQLAALLQFAEREGHMFPSYGHPEVFEGTKVHLGQWCSAVRGSYWNLMRAKRRGATHAFLSQEHIAELEELGFFDPDPRFGG